MPNGAGSITETGLACVVIVRKTRCDELAERLGAVADGVFRVGVHLAEGLRPAIWQERRIVAEPTLAARRPDQRAVRLAAANLDMAVRPGERQGGDEKGAAIDLAGEPVLDALHRHGKILARSGPARRTDARVAAERRYDEAGVIGERRQAGAIGGSPRLED